MEIRLKFIRKIKYYFFKFRLHLFIPTRYLTLLAYFSSVSNWISRHKKIKYSDFPTSTFDYGRRVDLFSFIIENEILNVPIEYLEFGVSKGHSFKWWVKNIANPNSVFHGFDTFSGLPESWGPFKKGAMSNENKPPEIKDLRCHFYQGLFQTTLPKFLKNYQSDKKKIIHIDVDLYSAALFVLTTLSPYLNKGDIILFDEFNVPLHEYKAFKEWTEAYYIDYKVLAEVNNFFQVAFKLK